MAVDAAAPAAVFVAVGVEIEKARMSWCLSIGGIGGGREHVAWGGDGQRGCGRMLK